MSPPTTIHTTPSTPNTKTPPRSLLHTLTSSLISISTLAGGAYLVRSYTQARLEDVRMKMERDGRARDGLRTRFLQTHDDVSYTVLALLPTLGQQVGNGRGMDVESLIGELKRAGRGMKGREKEKGRIEDKEKEKETEGEGEAGGRGEEQGGRRTSLNPHAREFVPRVGTPSSVSVDGSVSSSESVSADVDMRGVNASYPPNPYPALSSRSSSPGSTSASGVSSSFVSVSGSISGSGYVVSAVSGSSSDVGMDADRDVEGSERMSASFMSVHTEDTDTDSMVSGEGGGEREERKRSKAELWNEVKIQTFTRALTTIYTTVLLCTLTTVQLTLIARANYVSSVIALEKEEKRRERVEERMGRVLGVQGIMMEVMGGVVRKWWGLGRGKGKGREGEEEEEEDVMERFLKSLGGIEDDDEAEEHEDEGEGGESDKFPVLNLDAYAQSQFLTLSWWLLHLGHEDLAARVRESVHVALDGVGLKMALRVGDLERVIGEIRRGVEGDSDVLGNAVVPPTEEMVRMVLVKGGGDRNPVDEERAEGSTTAPGKDETKNDAFTALLTELRAVVRSAEWRATIEKGVDVAVDVLIRSVFVGGRRGSREVGQEAEEPGEEEEKIRLASLLPGLARWSQLALEGLPSEVVDEILATRELGCLSALVFGKFEDRFGAGVGVGPGP